MIRAATKADAPTMAQCHARCFNPAWSEPDIIGLLDTPGAFAVILSEHPEQGFALARCAADEAEILTIAVDPDQRRKSYGAKLLAALESACLQSGADSMFLEVSDRNAAAQALYQASGYRPAGSRQQYYADGSNALILKKTLR